MEKQPVLVLVTLVPLPAADVLTNNLGRSQKEGSGGAGSPGTPLPLPGCPEPRAWPGRAGAAEPGMPVTREAEFSIFIFFPFFLFFFLNSYVCPLWSLAEEGVWVEVLVLFPTAKTL